MMRLKKIKSYMMPISMLIGIGFYNFFSQFSFLTQYLIFFMLLISYMNISLKEIRLTKLHLYLICIQVFGSILVYLGLLSINPILAQGTMICILAPTATAAIVITAMLGGNAASLTAYSLLSNITVAILAPVLFSLINVDSELSFWAEFFQIIKKTSLLLLVPFLIGIVINKLLSKTGVPQKPIQSMSFLLWNIALIIVTAGTVKHLLIEGNNNWTLAGTLFVSALIVCILQFIIGRFIGKRFDDTVAGGQGLGQKNTILAIWMSQTYLNPLASIAPGAYILWQNLINSYQIWKKQV